MKKQQLLEYINLFREKSENNKLIIFVGAGVSCNVEGMPSWYSLIQKMAQAINYNKCSICRHKEKCSENCLLFEDYSTDEFLKIPQYVYNKNKKIYNRILKENISDAAIDAPLSSAIFDINPVHIITTNYDKLIESSSSEFCKQYQVIISDKDLLLSEKNKYIIKMHGDVSLQDTIVLKEQDYLNYSQNHVLIELFLKSLLTDHTILFLGYSLNGYNIKLIISWLNYMRTQNKALTKKQKVGYIVLDEEKINRTQLSYFAGNNIGVINIRKMPLLSDIPVELFDVRGKRLYSFLKTISNPSLEGLLSSDASIEMAVDFMYQYAFVDHVTLLKLLYIKQYNKTGMMLRLYNENDYNLLEQFMNCETVKASQLKQLFTNCGIKTLCYTHFHNNKKYSIDMSFKDCLFSDELFLLYLHNQYVELGSRLNDKQCNLMKKYFYQSIIYGYSEAMINYNNNIDFSKLSLDNQVASLHNTAILQFFQTYSFNSRKVKHFIENMALTKEKEMFSTYLDIYNGNSKKILDMKISLEKLNSNITANTVHLCETSYSEIYKMQNNIISQYHFYFLNHLFFKGFNDLNRFFRPYIEAIMCANTDQAEKSTDFPISQIDFDIITKFISSKDLWNIINTYNVKRVKTNEENILFLCNCFNNLCYSIIEGKTYGFNLSSITTLLNLVQMLELVDLTDKCKETIQVSFMDLMSNPDFTKIFFSVSYNDFRISVKIIAELCKLLTFSFNIDIINNIISSSGFYDFAVNVNFHCIRSIIISFAKIDLIEENQNQIEDIIESVTEFHKKIILLRLLYKSIINDDLKSKYINFLSDNFLKLDTYALYDFVFDDWIKPSPTQIDSFLNRIIDMNNKKVKGVYQMPDPVETELECAYILYIEGIIPDISVLNDLSADRPHLQFLLNPNEFDYTQVNFSNYMWENFARNDKYMKLFIEHKESIIPSIKEHLKVGIASETEKKIFYGFLLNGEELWNY